MTEAIKNRKNLIVLLAAFFAVYVFWGSTYLAIKYTIDMGSFPHEFSGYRHVSDEGVRATFEEVWGVALQGEPGLRIRSLTTRPGTSNDSAVSPSLPSSCSHGAGETHPRASSLPSRRPRRLLRRPLASVAPSGRSASRRAPRTPTMAPRERREAGWASERARPSKRRASTANLPTSTTKTSASAGSARPIPGARATSGERAPRQGVVIEVRTRYEAASLACQPL